MSEPDSNLIKDLSKCNPELTSLSEVIHHNLVNNPPLSLSDGGLIHDQVDQQLDGLRNKLDDQENWLAKQESKEKKDNTFK